MLGNWLQSKITRITLWTAALTLGFYDVFLAGHWWRAGLYILGAAMCATMHHKFVQTVGAASVAAYVKGREHNERIEQTAQVISIGRRR